jgi:hypothetical protein
MTVTLLTIASSISAGHLPQASPNQGEVSTILSIVFGIIGALALLMIVVSGLRYITSAGNPEKTSKAKNGIVYAIVGLVIAVSAEAIVAYGVNNL